MLVLTEKWSKLLRFLRMVVFLGGTATANKHPLQSGLSIRIREEPSNYGRYTFSAYSMICFPYSYRLRGQFNNPPNESKRSKALETSRQVGFTEFILSITPFAVGRPLESFAILVNVFYHPTCHLISLLFLFRSLSLVYLYPLIMRYDHVHIWIPVVSPH